MNQITQMLCSIRLAVISEGHPLMNSQLDQVSLKWLVWPFCPLLSESLWRNVCNFVTVTKCDGMWFSVKEQFFSKGKKEFLFPLVLFGYWLWEAGWGVPQALIGLPDYAGSVPEADGCSSSRTGGVPTA